MAETSLVAKFVMDVAALVPEGELAAAPPPDDPALELDIAEIARKTQEFLRVASHWEHAMTETTRLERAGAGAEPLHLTRDVEQRAYQATVAAQRALDALVQQARDAHGEATLAADPRWHLLEMVDDCFSQALSAQHTRYFAKGPLGAL